jgi:hypothetical protein
MTSHELFRRKLILHLSFHGFIRKTLCIDACNNVSKQRVFDIESRNQWRNQYWFGKVISGMQMHLGKTNSRSRARYSQISCNPKFRSLSFILSNTDTVHKIYVHIILPSTHSTTKCVFLSVFQVTCCMYVLLISLVHAIYTAHSPSLIWPPQLH